MSWDLLSQLSDALVIAGGLVALFLPPLVFLAGCTNAPPVRVILEDEKCKSTISAPSFLSPAGTRLMDLSRGYTADQRSFKCSVVPATPQNPRRKTVSEERTKRKRPLVQRLKEIVEETRQREVAKRIEEASAKLLGDDYHFVYTQEANALSVVPLDRLDAFVSEVKRIRTDLETEYALAAQQLGEQYEEYE